MHGGNGLEGRAKDSNPTNNTKTALPRGSLARRWLDVGRTTGSSSVCTDVVISGSFLLECLLQLGTNALRNIGKSTLA